VKEIYFATPAPEAVSEWDEIDVQEQPTELNIIITPNKPFAWDYFRESGKGTVVLKIEPTKESPGEFKNKRLVARRLPHQFP
jgi:hypothetical protein